MTWTVELGAAGGSLTTYDRALPLMFVRRLNAIGWFSALVLDTESNPDPTRDDLVRFTWDKGGTDERVFFEGYAADVRRDAKRKNIFRLRGLSLEGLLWQSGTGGIREWRQDTPHTIIQGSGDDTNLLTTAQGAKRSIGSTTVQYGANSVPWKLTGTDPGLALDFRADSSRLWRNIQRLTMQARGDQDNYPSWADESPDGSGDKYGLEAWVQIDTVNGNAEPRLYVASRRERSANVSPEVFTIPTDMPVANRGEEGLTAAEAIKVVGSGSGRERVETSVIGSGGIEGVTTDKTIINATVAENQARRLQGLLDPSVDVLTGWRPGHVYDTDLGDRVTFQETDQSDETLRVFVTGYQLQKRSFFFVAGRPRPLSEDPFRDLGSLATGHAHGTQRMGQNFAGTAVTSTAGVADGDNIQAEATLDPDYRPQIDEALNIHADVTTSAVDTLLGVEVQVNTTVLERGRVRTVNNATDDGGIWTRNIHVGDELIQEVFGTSDITSATLVVTNRDGASRDLTGTIHAFIQR